MSVTVSPVKAYWLKILLGVDILLCMLLFRDPDVTISSETGLALRGSSPPLWARVFGAVLNTLQKDHCEQAIAGDIQRANTAIAYLTSVPPRSP